MMLMMMIIILPVRSSRPIGYSTNFKGSYL